MNGANGEPNAIRGRAEYDSAIDGQSKSSNKPSIPQMFGDFALDGSRNRDGSFTSPSYSKSGQFHQPTSSMYDGSHSSTAGGSSGNRPSSMSSSDVSSQLNPGSFPTMDSQTQLAAQAQLIEALAMQSLQDSQFSKELSQALASHLTAQLGNSNAELLAAKGKVLETMALLEKAQQHAAKVNTSNVTSSPSSGVNTHSPNQAYMQPIKINTQHGQPAGVPSSSAHGVTWSGSSTPNSMAESSNSSGYESHQGLSAKSASAHLKLLQQKTFPPPRLPPQSPIPSYLAGKQLAGFPRNGFKHPLLPQQQQKHFHTTEGNSDSVSQAQAVALEARNPHANMTTPDPQSVDRSSLPPHLRDLPVPPRLVFSKCNLMKEEYHVAIEFLKRIEIVQ